MLIDCLKINIIFYIFCIIFSVKYVFRRLRGIDEYNDTERNIKRITQTKHNKTDFKTEIGNETLAF